MKIGRKSKEAEVSKVRTRHNMKFIPVIAVAALAVIAIIWVMRLGKKAEQTVMVAMYNQTISKNEMVTENMLSPYEMLLAEYEKYSYKSSSSGQIVRRVVLWDERSNVINKYAAYTLKSNTLVENRDVISSKIDNTDSVMYSYPGKNIVTLSVGTSDLSAFKAFLQPGDRINLVGIYTDTQTVTDETGRQVSVDTVREQTIFTDILLADLLNASGDSILDIYEAYNNKTAYQQEQLDNSESFQSSVTPSTMLLALTPEQEEMFYRYAYGTSGIQFKISLPQRNK